MTVNDDIAAALGKRLWKTESFVPQYRAGEYGSWRINPGGQLVNDWGYHSGPCLVEMLPSLSRKVTALENAEGDGWETWMSLTPHEIESQELGFIHAVGDVVVMGLGLGWIAANIAMNPNVATVTVVENDPEVIELFSISGASDTMPESARSKIKIVQGNAMKWNPVGTVDFLYADIWLHLAEQATLQQVREMDANIRPGTIYFWGQEIAIYSAAKRYVDDKASLTTGSVRQALTEVIQLPLLIPDDRDYLGMIGQVIQNRIDRRLTVDFNF